MNTDTLKLIFNYANKFDIECDPKANESSIATHLAKLSFTQHKKATAYNKELQYFNQVADTLRSVFGDDQVSIIYHGNPHTFTGAGSSTVAIKDIIVFDMITNSESVGQAQGFLSSPICVFGDIIDERTYKYINQDWGDNLGSRWYNSVMELVEAIQDMPLWEDEIQQKVAFEALGGYY